MQSIIKFLLPILLVPVMAMKEDTIRQMDIYPMQSYGEYLKRYTHYVKTHNPPPELWHLRHYVELPVSLTLKPSPSHVRIFASRSLDQYVEAMKRDGKPTCLIIGCGHEGEGYGKVSGFRACHHNEDYFTVNIDPVNGPDILCDAFGARDYTPFR